MIIQKVSHIIQKIIEYEQKKIVEFEPKIKHGPTIGSQYEGITIKALDFVIPDKFNIQVRSGFIRNSKDELSGQIDCMVCYGDGELIPGTSSEYIYDIQNVILAIEVKKKLFTSELSDAHDHLLSVNNLICDFKSIPAEHVEFIHKAFAKITGKIIKKRADVYNLNNDLHEMIYHGLISQFIMPLRIIIGFDGFSSEKSLRNKFAEFISANPLKKGFGPFSMPNLILCGNNALLKLNCEPYMPAIENNFFEFYVSSVGHNLKILTELLFSRLARNISFDFTEDNTQEPLRYFLGAKLVKLEEKTGWEYTYHDFDLNKLENDVDDNYLKWNPEFVSKVAHDVFVQLCQNEISINSDFFKQAQKDEPDILNQLLNTKFVALHNDTIDFTTYNLRCAILPDGKFAVGDDNHGYFTKWLLEYQTRHKAKCMK